MTSPSLAFEFATDKTLVDKVSGRLLITFTRASTATFFDASGTLQTASAGVPRFTHDPVTLQSLGLLIEGASTNLLLNSDSLSTQSLTVTAVAHTLSFTGTGTVTLSGASTAGPLVGTGSGWGNRVALTFTPTADTLTLTVSGTVAFAQLETGPRDTSYIPTAGSTVTRQPDSALMDGVNFPGGWYDTSAGSLFCQSRSQGSRAGNTNTIVRQWDFRNAANAERWFSFLQTVTGGEGIRVQTANGGLSTTVSRGIYTPGTVWRTAAAGADNDFAFASSAEPTVATYTTRVMPVGLDRFQIGGPNLELHGTISRLYYWPERLANATLTDYATNGAPVYDLSPLQFLGPSSNITQTNYTGGFADIDEAVRDDSDYAYGAVNSSAPTLTVGLSAPAETPLSGTCKVRWTHARANSSGAIGGGSPLDYTCTVLQGSTTLASQTVTPDGWGESSFTFAASLVSDWTDLRLRWTQTASGGGGPNPRGGAVSWAEVAVPGGAGGDATASYTGASVSTVAGSWEATGNAAADYNGATTATTAAAWTAQIAVDAIAAWDGATTTTTAGFWVASGAAIAAWTGVTTATTAATWAGTATATALWTGVSRDAIAGSWAASGASTAAWNGVTTATVAGVWSADGTTSAQASYSGSTTVTTAATWAAAGDAQADYAGGVSSTSPAIWQGSGTASAFAAYTGSSVVTTAAIWAATGSAAAAWLGASTATTAAAWEASGPALAAYEGVATSTSAGAWAAAGLNPGTANYVGASTATTGAIWVASGNALANFDGVVVETTAAEWAASAVASAAYGGTESAIAAGDWIAAGTAIATWAGVTGTITGGSWVATAPSAGDATYSGASNTVTGAAWSASGSAMADASGGTTDTTTSEWVASGDALAAFIGVETFTSPAQWSDEAIAAQWAGVTTTITPGAWIAAPVYGTWLFYFNGTQWEPGVLKQWDGAQWRDAVLSVYREGEWRKANVRY